MRIEYLDGERLRRSLIAGCEYVQHRRAELNRINVFPVPDGDTGTNLALTASAIADGLRSLRDRSVAVVARRAADSAIMGARGNCGMILSHFLLGFSGAVGVRGRLDTPAFAGALDSAVGHVYRSLERPVEGTIVTVMREVAEEARVAGTVDFAELIESLLSRARSALARTPELLPVLKTAGVVDAGAKGFMHLFEGIVAYTHGDPFVALSGVPAFAAENPVAARVEYPDVTERFRFCTEALVRGEDLPAADAVRSHLRELGDSLIVIRGDNLIKVHIHTDDPDTVYDYLRGCGKLITHKAEDMVAQHAAVERAAGSPLHLTRRPISILTDSASNLPDEVIRAHGIHVVPMLLVYEDEVLRDGVDIDAGTFVDRLRAGQRATTSQPAPATFIEGYRRAAEDGETVLALMVGSNLSGTFKSAVAAAQMVEDLPVRVFDTQAAGLSQGMLALLAAELAEAGRPVDEVLLELQRVRGQSGTLLTVDVFDNLLASGRVGRGKVMIAGLLDIKPILELAPDGRVIPLANVRGSSQCLPRILRILEERIPRGARAVRFGIMHVGRPEIAVEVADQLIQRFGEKEILDVPATSVLATHLGPGAWGVAYQVED